MVYRSVQSLGVKKGSLDQFKQALELLHTKMTEGGRLKKAGEALPLKFKKEEIASILGRMEHPEDTRTDCDTDGPLVSLRTGIARPHCSQVQANSLAIKTKRASFRHIPTIKSGLVTIRQDQDHAQHDKLMAWISPTDFPAQQSDFIGRRQERTGQ
jgi:hypothetical protein